MSKHHVSSVINGEPVEFLCEPQQTLLDCLRDELHLTGSKEGCGSGDCGACTVIVDGNIVCSCLMLGVEAEGRTVLTVEGVAEGEKLHPVQQKFLEHAASNAASAHRALSSRRRRCSTKTRTRPRKRRATGSPAIFAAAPVTTKSSAPSSMPRRSCAARTRHRPPRSRQSL